MRNPITDDCPDNIYGDIPAHSLASEPAANETNHDYDEETFIRDGREYGKPTLGDMAK